MKTPLTHTLILEEVPLTLTYHERLTNPVTGLPDYEIESIKIDSLHVTDLILTLANLTHPHHIGERLTLNYLSNLLRDSLLEEERKYSYD